ncbi:pyruvate:ferredoxin (flavodoxin) oxidoreductase [Vibrio metschnikovii]|uniref:pyruvate:ferredoxin (flavodoxin) oxidoreductase n=1 Tax=Vibrio metschnikovii TaxID=28172 RepID=UPI001302A38F|nr:pyruvate:ferredoxin (flavodoxin) oxidoreductase [Vibrio metschnikovii]
MNWITDANTAVAQVAYQLSEVIAVYPITPSTTMAEKCESWAAQKRPNLLGEVPQLIEMQSEAGTIAVVHGSAMSGALATTFTSSQGLLLMIPTLYKLVGELTPCVIHVAARALATHALSIFCDHSDVMSVRQTGVAMLCATDGQQAQDMALIATLSSLRCRLPFIHFFDGFITSHALTNLIPLDEQTIKQLLSSDDLLAFRQRALTPDRPSLRGATADSDSYFQCREAQNSYHQQTPSIVQSIMDDFAAHTGRQYHLVSYTGHPQATQVIVALGSVTETLKSYVDQQVNLGQKIGVISIHLYRPFPSEALLEALPNTVQQIAVLDRTKEPGSSGEPLYLDVLHALQTLPRSITLYRGRYGLAGKPFYPEDAEQIFNMLSAPQAQQKREFVIGISDDKTHLNLPIAQLTHNDDHLQQVLMYGYGGDGSVSAGKNVLKVLGQHYQSNVNAQFEYDSKKSRNITTSHLRFSSQPIRTPYPIRQAQLISLSQEGLLRDIDISTHLAHRAILLINTNKTGSELWYKLPTSLQAVIQAKQIRVITLDADQLVAKHQLNNKTSVVMQVATTLLLTNQQDNQALLTQLRNLCEQQLQGKSAELITRSIACIEATPENINYNPFAAHVASSFIAPTPCASAEPLSLVEQLLARQGNSLPVSAFPADGCWPTNTSHLEKRDISEQLPVWSEDLCTQCGYCVAICPHSAIRARIVEPTEGEDLSPLKTMPYRSRHQPDAIYTLQVSPNDCTGCQLCANVCPGKDKKNPERKSLMMVAKPDCYDQEVGQFERFEALPTQNIYQQERIDVKTLQHVEPYFEYPNACAGCGETAYIRTLTQLFGDRLYIANATGCSSIFGGNLPTTPYSQNADRRGPAWANSLFEDNAEFGLGMKLAVKALQSRAEHVLAQQGGSDNIQALNIPERRQQIQALQNQIEAQPQHAELHLLLDYLVEKQVWLIGGDGWAYDIGFGGLDHVLRSGENINILVLDTQCYANTGGQKSKSTPQGQTAKLCSEPNPNPAKDLIELYRHVPGVYVARIALAANMNHTIKTLKAAGEHQGPSLVIAYSPCIEHNYDLAHSAEFTRNLVKSGDWPLHAEVGGKVTE